MATIKARRQADGTVRYTAIVRKRAGKEILHSGAKTFTLRSAALSWAKHTEVQLETYACHGSAPLSPLLSTRSSLQFLERHPIADKTSMS